MLIKTTPISLNTVRITEVRSNMQDIIHTLSSLVLLCYYGFICCWVFFSHSACFIWTLLVLSLVIIQLFRNPFLCIIYCPKNCCYCNLKVFFKKSKLTFQKVHKPQQQPSERGEVGFMEGIMVLPSISNISQGG